MSKLLTVATLLFLFFACLFMLVPAATSSSLPGLSPLAVQAATTSPSSPVPYNCETAQKHKHDAIVEGAVQVVDWSGCILTAKSNGKFVRLYGGGDFRNYHGFLHIQYDRTCGQILFARPDVPGQIIKRVGKNRSATGKK